MLFFYKSETHLSIFLLLGSYKINLRPPPFFRAKKHFVSKVLLFYIFAVWTGLEPATSAVTGRHSNQLNYQTSL